MRNLGMPRSATSMVVAAVLLCACGSGSPGAQPRTSPAPVTHETARTVEYDALLKAMHPGEPVYPQRRETVHTLAKALARMGADVNAGTGTAALSPSAEHALREFSASPGTEEMQRVLKRMIAERTVPDTRR